MSGLEAEASGSTSDGTKARYRIAALLLTWYTISSSIIFTSKWMLNGRFPFPLTVTTISNIVTGVWAVVVNYAWVRRTAAERDVEVERVNLESVWTWVVPIAACTAAEIGCSNGALKELTVSFGTIIKGSAPVFVLLWALALRVESFSWKLFSSVGLISAGVAVAAVGETNFHVGGFILQIIAISFGGLRWAMTHVIMQKSNVKMTPLTATLYTAPLTAGFIAPVALVLEGSHIREQLHSLGMADSLRTLLVLVIIGSLVFVLLLAEYTLVRDTSSLAVAIAAVFKELLTIGGGVLLFKDSMSALNWLGFVIAHVGIGLYIQMRDVAGRAAERVDTEDEESGDFGSGAALLRNESGFDDDMVVAGRHVKANGARDEF